jgi:hypothetical protein
MSDQPAPGPPRPPWGAVGVQPPPTAPAWPLAGSSAPVPPPPGDDDGGGRVPSRRRAAVIAFGSGALVVVLLLAGVLVVRATRDEGPTPPGRPNGIEAMTAHEALSAMQAAVRSASSVRVTGSVIMELPDVERFRMDMRFTRAREAHGIFHRGNGQKLEILIADGKLYARGPLIWEHYGKAAADRIGDRWVLVPEQVLRETDYREHSGPTDETSLEPTDPTLPDSPEAVIRYFMEWCMNAYWGIDPMVHDDVGILEHEPDHLQPLRMRQGIMMAGGGPAIALEQGGMYVLVAAEGPPYPLEFGPMPDSGIATGDWRYGEWNAKADLAPPAEFLDLMDVKP